MRRSRQRRRLGLAKFSLTLDEFRAKDGLISAGALAASDADCHAAVERALQRVVEHVIERLGRQREV